MLADHDPILNVGGAEGMILAISASVNGNGAGRKIATGVYEIGHFGMTGYPRGVRQNEWDGGWRKHGVCDSYEQVVAHHPEVTDPERRFVITLTPVWKSEQEPYGGWRWHKWGEYIGTHTPQHEYLYYEQEIEMVYVYTVYEIGPETPLETTP
jgi:hypothetical protein